MTISAGVQKLLERDTHADTNTQTPKENPNKESKLTVTLN
jgi:hypothetical protein